MNRTNDIATVIALTHAESDSWQRENVITVNTLAVFITEFQNLCATAG